MNKRGFTLLEILIVFIIIAVLFSIALPQYAKTLEKARSTEAIINIFSIKNVLDAYRYENELDLTGATLPIDGSRGTLNIDNPNAIINKLYTYEISDFGSSAGSRSYKITATREINDKTFMVIWVQEDHYTGQLYRSSNLGGPEYSP